MDVGFDSLIHLTLTVSHTHDLQQLWIVMEYMDGGSLTNIIQAYTVQRRTMEEADIAGFMRPVSPIPPVRLSDGEYHPSIDDMISVGTSR